MDKNDKVKFIFQEQQLHIWSSHLPSFFLSLYLSIYLLLEEYYYVIDS